MLNLLEELGCDFSYTCSQGAIFFFNGHAIPAGQWCNWWIMARLSTILHLNTRILSVYSSNL
uniref:Putative ovule protein n=1 Tax=Solanum chacoense TaxID=4108 RepID=A0A0V0HUG2_SOLCH